MPKNKFKEENSRLIKNVEVVFPLLTKSLEEQILEEREIWLLQENLWQNAPIAEMN